MALTCQGSVTTDSETHSTPNPALTLAGPAPPFFCWPHAPAHPHPHLPGSPFLPCTCSA